MDSLYFARSLFSGVSREEGTNGQDHDQRLLCRRRRVLPQQPQPPHDPMTTFYHFNPKSAEKKTATHHVPPPRLWPLCLRRCRRCSPDSFEPGASDQRGLPHHAQSHFDAVGERRYGKGWLECRYRYERKSELRERRLEIFNNGS